MKKIIVTGGCGYIGAHTIVDLIENGFEVLSIDNNSKSSTALLDGVEKITGKKIKNYAIDLKNIHLTQSVFKEHKNIIGIIHFAAYKAVGESVEQPLLYYENNLLALINILKCVEKYTIPYFVFSSSCTVYGNPDTVPVTEQSPLNPAASPYGTTKQMGEQIVKDFAAIHTTKTVLLRYFNPVGAHPSNVIGEIAIGRPANLVPAITQTAIGKLSTMQVYGNDYPTRDGSCIRDFIHVCDIAHAHTLAIQYLQAKKTNTAYEIFNLGTGKGITVLEAIKAFEKVSGIKLNYSIGPRRAGDIMAIYANNYYACKTLHWNIKYAIEDMMRTAWNWECANYKQIEK